MDELLLLLGEKIRTVREARGLSQEELAEMANINRSRISNIETGKINITINTLVSILNALEIHYADLFNFNEQIKTSDIKEKKYLLEIQYLLLKDRSLEEINYIVESTKLFIQTIDTKNKHIKNSQER
ncbi:helix-turn-helix domain-containing protein [Lysinibacillus piscis]|uniref:Transcriptional regulator n=1 Tax=Lysinibacillus piscis TaxID=2518931 RepID=A0ABQ5NNX7_9BACI|nr:helix-turn-helix transcriptional regulator [Lysinibacillus sp. KH24]GLC89796.1 transcriptional regulator [Lysinibacillus sp. KH24]